MKWFRKVSLLFCMLYVGLAHSQTVDDIINKHIEAMGGKDAINKITSQVTYTDLKLQGSNATSVTTLVPGKAFKSVMKLGGQEMIRCITLIGGWTVNELTGSREAKPLPEEQVKASQSILQPGGELFNYKANGEKIELIGTAKEQGVDAYKLKWTTSDGKQSAYFFIHPKTYYLIKREIIVNLNGKEITTTTVFTGHTKTDIGLVVPFTTTTVSQGSEVIASITKIEFNKEIDMRSFDMPDF